MTTMVATCMKCSKEFTHRSNLYRHMKEKHNSPEDITATNGTCKQYTCVTCDTKFKRKEHLKTHMDAVHVQGKELKCDVPKCNFTTVYKRSLAKHLSYHKKQDSCSDKSYECNLCAKRYKSKNVLNYHLKKKHLPTCTGSQTYKKVCPLCAFTVCNAVAKQTIQSMLKHFTEHHDIKIDYENLKFESIHEFKQWKSDLENEFNSRYRVIKTSKKNLRFTCHRSGIFTPKGCGKRSIKSNGSCKINGFCPASMTVNISDSGKIRVLFLKSHVGHTNDLKFVNLSEADKKNIAASVANKIPYEEILKKVRRDATGGNLKRIHLITRKDLINIAKTYNLGDESLNHSFDPVSVQDISNITNMPNKTNFFEERESFLLHLSTLIREKVTNFEELEAVITQCKPIPHILNAIKTMPSSSAPVIVDKKPANTKIIKQRKSFSTMKRKRKGGVPTFSCEQNNSIAVQLMEEKSQDIREVVAEGEATTVLEMNMEENVCMVDENGMVIQQVEQVDDGDYYVLEGDEDGSNQMLSVSEDGTVQMTQVMWDEMETADENIQF